MSHKPDPSLHGSLAKYGPKPNTIYLKLHDYKYFHTSSNFEKSDSRIIGRHSLKAQLFSLFTNGQTKNGTYLITGSRGMGKTSLVNDVLKRWRNKKDFKWRLVLTSLGVSILVSLWFVFLCGQIWGNEVKLSWVLIILASIVLSAIGIFSLVMLKRWIYKERFIWKDVIGVLVVSILVFFWFTFLIDEINHNVIGTSWIWVMLAFISLVALGILSKMMLKSGKPNSKISNGEFFFREHGTSSKTALIVVLVSVVILIAFQLFNDTYLVLVIYTAIYILSWGVYYLLYRSNRKIEHEKSGDNGFFVKDVLIVNLDIGQEDINETRILKQIVSRLGEMCSKVHRQVHFIRNLGILGVSVLLSWSIVALLYNVPAIHEIGQSPTWLEYFPTQKNTDFQQTQGESLQLSRLKIQSLDTLFEEHTNKDPEPSESIGWLLHNVNETVKSTTRIIDHAVNEISKEVYPIFFKSLHECISKTLRVRDSPYYLKQETPSPYYLMILVFIGSVIFLNFLIKWILNKYYPPYYVKGEARVKRLTDRIYAETSEVAVAGLSQNRFFNWNRRKTITLPFAGKYEIQMEVQKIVDELSSGFSWVPFIRMDRQIVFVLDELDKIEPDRYYQESSPSSESEPAKTRQQRITRMLQSLKSFFNHSKAKFIFIAGDDMYDASIADASNNREHSIDRLFNKVFYIPSFYSDDSDHRKSNTNSMTESYVSQFLISEKQYNFLEGETHREDNDIEKEKTKLLNSTLEKYYSLFFPSTTHDSDKIGNIIYIQKDALSDRSLANLARVKVLYTLKNFITYLAYQSNGSPKKITSLFEQYVVRGGEHPMDLYSMVITNDSMGNANETGLDQQCFYLRLNEGGQYVFGLINYLVSPFLISQKRYLGSFGDKLLVSTSFIVDHLYKYHENAFSWKTLELTPEIISVNKAPQLRGFIKDIMYHFSRTHIDRITSGLFDFKFIGKVKNEIRYLSKVSDLEAAAFNFTLDESKQSKNHYQDKLKELRAVYHNRLSGESKNDDQKFIHSLSFTNMILGDLEYYDQEYDNAVLYYMDAIQELRYLLDETSKNYIFNAIIYVRNSLKLGLAFEKQNNYDSALMTYDRLKQEILNLRDVDTSKFGYEEKVITYDHAVEFISKQIGKVGLSSLYAAFDQSGHSFSKLDQDLETMTFDKCFDALGCSDPCRVRSIVNNWALRIAKVYETFEQWEQVRVVALLFYNLFQDRDRIFVIVGKKNGKFFSFGGNHFFKTYINQQAASKKHIQTNGKLFTFENLRLLYQPFIAALSILEKDGINAITNKSIESTLKDFDFICRMTNTHVPYMIEVEFLNKIGDLLYFKNGMLKDWSNTKDLTKQKVATNEGVEPNELAKRDYNLPVQGMIFYLLSIDVFWKGIASKDRTAGFYQGSEGDNGTYHVLFQKIKSKTGDYRFFGGLILNKYREAVEYINKGIGSPEYTNPRSIKLNTLANCYSDLGNSILSSISQDKRNWTQASVLRDLQLLLNLITKLNDVLFARHSNCTEEDSNDILNSLDSKVFSIQGVVTAYLISAALYHKTYKNLKSAFQLQKIMTLIDDCIFIAQGIEKTVSSSLTKVERDELLFKIDTELLIPYVTKVNKAYQDTPWQDMANYKNAGGLVSSSERTSHVLNVQKVVESHLQKPFKNRAEAKSSFYRIKRQVRVANGNGHRNEPPYPNIDFEFYKGSSIASEQKEVYVLMEKIQFRLNSCEWKNNQDKYEGFCHKYLKTHPFIDNSNQMNRIHELFIRGTKLKKFFKLKIFDYTKVKAAKLNLIALIESKKKSRKASLFELRKLGIRKRNYFRILSRDEDLLKIFSDALYSYNEIISKLNVIEASFQVPNIYFGFAHYELAYWLEALEEFPELQFEVFENLEYITLERENDFLNKQYQWAKAKYHFVTAMQTHRGMDPYTHTINGMYYLDDDFNDDQEHFYAAQERFHINNGYIQRLCKELGNKLINADKLFNYDFYSTDFVPDD
ncbi:MAG: DMT family transporter [Marinoscillum sp.]